MSDLISHTARLVPYAKRPKHVSSFVTAYVYEPAADEAGAKLGNLYVVVEVLVSGRASEEVVDLVIQTVGDKYYNDPNDQLSPLARFEAAIKQTNHELAEHVGHGNAAWIGKLSAIIAVQCGAELHVAQTGSGEAFLYRGKAASKISQSETSRPATPSKTFGSIATGELEIGDKILIATPALVHQIPLAKLQSVVSNGSPNAAIAELSQLINGASPGRIAALVVEITTPELAALKVRSEEPNDVLLGPGENLAEVAIRVATPIAHNTADTSKKAAKAAVSSWKQRIKPQLRRLSLAAINAIRDQLATRRGRRIALVLAAVLVVTFAGTAWFNQTRNNDSKLFTTYQGLFKKFDSAQTAARSGDTDTARQLMVAVQTDLNKLKANDATINKQLKNNPLYDGEPSTAASFRALVADQIDQLDGLIKVAPTTIGQVSTKGAKLTHFETDGTRAYIINSGNNNNIVIMNLQTGLQRDSSANTSKLDDVINTTISSNNDGMYILTSKPGVWFYQFATDTLSEITVAYGTWPKASAIASYAANIYLLGDTAVYKHTRNASGYSPKTEYIPTAPIGSPTSALAVDGSIYVMTPGKLNRFLGTSLKTSSITPASLSKIHNLRSIVGGDFIIGTDQTSSRIGIWSAKNNQLKFDKQISLTEGKALYDATYDSKQGKVFAILDNRLVSFAIKP